MAEQVGDATLEALGYKPEFKRVLSRRDLILYGLVILTPTAPYPVYGIVQKISHGHAADGYLEIDSVMQAAKALWIFVYQ